MYSKFDRLVKASALTESAKVPPPTDEPGVGETLRFPESVTNRAEEDIVALEERARKVGGTGESSFANRSPFAPATSSLSPYSFSTFQSISSVLHIPHITSSKYFKGCNLEQVDEIIEQRTCRLGQAVYYAAHKNNVFYLWKEDHDVPRQVQDKCIDDIT